MTTNIQSAIEALREAKVQMVAWTQPWAEVDRALALLTAEPEGEPERCGFSCDHPSLFHTPCPRHRDERGHLLRGEEFCGNDYCHPPQPRPPEPTTAEGPTRRCVRCGVLLGSVYVVECTETLCGDCAFSSPEGREFVLYRINDSYWQVHTGDKSPLGWAPNTEVIRVRETHKLKRPELQPVWQPVTATGGRG